MRFHARRARTSALDTRVDAPVFAGQDAAGARERLVERARPAGPTLNPVHVTESFTGDLVGEGTVKFLQAQRADGSASFCGIERVTGMLARKKFSFLLHDEGTHALDQVQGRWFVLPGSGTDELAGLRGEGTFEAKLGAHSSFTLDYRFEA